MIESHLRWLIELPAFAMRLLERDDIPEDAKEEARAILGLREKATRYTPPVSPFVADVTAEVE